MSMLPMGKTPVSFRDPLYEQLARAAESQHDLPFGILNAVRTMGERSNANQVSSAGARSVYQFIPKTRLGMIKNYGVDPWKDAESATNAAALLLAENHKRTGDWNEAIGQYHGGLDKRNWGPRTRSYIDRVSKFDEDGQMPRSLYPVPYYGPDPLAPLPQRELTSLPEKIKETAPVAGDLGPSVAAPAAAPAVAKKRGGLLGALESVLMPEADSRWAAALRGGIWDAKANQQAYKAGVQKQQTDTAMANAKLKNLLTKGEYQIAGNNLIHFPPDGGAPVVIQPPASKGEKERLIDRWHNEQDPEVKELMERMLLGANSDPVLQSRESVARVRANATTTAARTRSSGTTSAKPPAGFILDK